MVGPHILHGTRQDWRQNGACSRGCKERASGHQKRRKGTKQWRIGGKFAPAQEVVKSEQAVIKNGGKVQNNGGLAASSRLLKRL